ncbi:S-layer homology domain-containing protein [Paenibacillus sinopodophylli]|uniref:S-layer homology domain-containing protein n=1 Tax=Paenibacillus sinopodophylli TaxID=1837342 RepID=UPI001485F89F|nr:S-layer homology domain-containing protein [Paenibacillus sinopodophylli]
MKLRQLNMMLVIMLCFMLVPVTAFASTAAVTINAIEPVEQSGNVVISGTSTLDEVIIKVLRPGSSVVFYTIVPVSGGTFSSSFTLASREIAGTYKVVAGQAEQVATLDFTVKAASTGGGDNGGDNGGSAPIGTIETPATVSGKPITPPKSSAVPVSVDTSKNEATPSKDADGRATTVVKQNAAALAEALAKAAKQDNGGAAPIVYIAYNNAAGEKVQFNLSSAELAAAAVAAPNSIISLQTNDGEYSLPLNIIDFAAIAQALGASSEGISIQITIAPATTDLDAKIKLNAQGISASQLGIAIDFTVSAIGNGKSIELNQFGSVYVDRSIVLSTAVNDKQATVVLYDPLTGAFSFVPALFEKQADGSTKVTFKRNGNSIYTVLSSAKTFNDVSTHWAKADIELLASKLVVNGVTESNFAPNSQITRAEFAALLVRSLGLPADAASASFADVKSSDWFAGAVAAAAKAKLVDGFSDNSFKPNDTITREQMAVMIARAITAAGVKAADAGQATGSLTAFKDQASISSWAQAAVAQAVEADIITGMTAETFVPAANATRAQAAVMLKRFLQHTHFIN